MISMVSTVFRLTAGFSLALALVVACDGDDGGSGSDEVCWQAAQDAKPATTDDIMTTWGSPCETNADCVAAIGDGAICDELAVIFELPGKYCTKPCIVGDDPNVTDVTFELNDPECDPNGGIACVGANGIYSRCAPPCTGDEQCGREGYFCRRMPQISGAGDPTFCLMDDCCEGDCTSAP